MNYANIKYNDIANGEGIRTTLFVSGCPHHCKGCFNQIAWDYGYGNEVKNDTIEHLMDSCDNLYCDGLSLLGGEPLCPQNIQMVTEIAKEFKNKFPNKTIWCWTGYLYEEIKDFEIINYIDVLIDGKFEIDKRDLTLKWRGSSNQRIINIRLSRQSNMIVLEEI